MYTTHSCTVGRYIQKLYLTVFITWCKHLQTAYTNLDVKGKAWECNTVSFICLVISRTVNFFIFVRVVKGLTS